MNFKTVLASTLIAASALVAPVAAQAEMICDNSDGMVFCGTPGRYQDELMVTHPSWGTEQIKISCSYGEYNANSTGDWTQWQLEFFSDNYCEGRGYYSHN